MDEALNRAQAAIDEAKAQSAPISIKGKTNGLKSSEFWVTIGLAVANAIDAATGANAIPAGVNQTGIAYILGRSGLKAVMMAAQAYLASKQPDATGL